MKYARSMSARPIAKKKAEESLEQRAARISASATRHIAILTYVLAAVAILTLWELIQGGADTKTLVGASKQQACAAKSFAASADKINTGIGNAVTKLGKQADDAEEFFRTDERAWVVVDQIILLESYPPRNTFPWSFKYGVYVKNAGKTIARDVRIHITHFFGATQLNKHGIEMTQGRTWGGWKGKDLTPEQAGPHSLAPGERSSFPIVSGGSAPNKWGWVETVIGHIDYIDAFGAQHWKNFCYVVIDDKGTLNHCEGGGNDEDNNPEPLPNPN